MEHKQVPNPPLENVKHCKTHPVPKSRPPPVAHARGALEACHDAPPAHVRHRVRPQWPWCAVSTEDVIDSVHVPTMFYILPRCDSTTLDLFPVVDLCKKKTHKKPRFTNY